MSRPAAVAIDAETKVCSACGLEKPASEFYRHASGYMRGKCKACWNADTRAAQIADRPRVAARARAWRKNNRRAYLDASLRYRFGIGIEDYERMWAEQDGRCAVCRDQLETDGSTHVDHNHETGEVRGLVCRLCNLMLGFAKDEPNRLRAAAAYLEARG